MHPQDRVRDLLEQPGVNERWWELREYPYEINIFGHVRRIGGSRVLSYREAKGYLTVELWGDRGRARKKVHRLVWLSIMGPLNPGEILNHLDSDRLNPALSNLEPTTHRGNTLHAMAAGRHKTNGCGRRGLDPGIGRLIREATLDGVGASAISRELGVSPATVERVRARWYRWFEEC